MPPDQHEDEYGPPADPAAAEAMLLRGLAEAESRFGTTSPQAADAAAQLGVLYSQVSKVPSLACITVSETPGVCSIARCQTATWRHLAASGRCCCSTWHAVQPGKLCLHVMQLESVVCYFSSET